MPTLWPRHPDPRCPPPPGWQGAGAAGDAAAEPWHRSVPRCSRRRGPGGARRARLSTAPAAESPRARWHRRVPRQDVPGTSGTGAVPAAVAQSSLVWAGRGVSGWAAGLGEEGVPQHSPTLGGFGELGWAFCSPKHCRAKGKAEETGQSLLLLGTSPCSRGDGDQGGVGAAPGRVPVHAPGTRRVKRVPPPAINTTPVPRG